MRRPLLVVGLAFVLGCGGAGRQVVGVGGVVTLDGRPLVNVRVAFHPIATSADPNPGPGSFGMTDAAGRYVLTLAVSPPRPGAVVGRHHVEVAGAGVPKLFDEKSPVTFAVQPGGHDDANIALTTPKNLPQMNTDEHG